MDYWDSIDYLLALPDRERFSSGPAGQTMSRGAMLALLKRLGNPEKGRHTVHVTGSKGKGSTATMIASILHESGYTTALYTSPHLHDYVERIQIELLPVSRFNFADAVTEIRGAIDEINSSALGPISTFGAITALFFYLARQNDVQWQIVEVGMGGREDATNVFQHKDAAIITPISLEHTGILGNTCAEIAAVKAGIVTGPCNVIVAAQNDISVLDVIKAECKEQKAQLTEVGSQCQIMPISHDSNGQSFVVKTANCVHKLHTGMLGEFQLLNAATAVAAAEALMPIAPEITVENIADGIASTELAGRLEQLTRHPITVVDGAHNGESMRALMAALDKHFDFDEFVCVLGVNNDKNLAEIIEAIAQMKPTLLIVSKSSSSRALAPEQIAAAAAQAGIATRVTQNIADAIVVARECAGHNDLLCITGSLYVVSEARQHILSLPVIK